MEPQAMKELHFLPGRPNSYTTNQSTQNIDAEKHTPLNTNLTEYSQFGSNFFNKLLTPNSQNHVPFNMLSPNTPCLNMDAIWLNEPRETQRVMSTERRLKRMISNRESARRSRIRRKQQVEELQSVVNQLQNMNNQLSDKVISLLESNQRILQENFQLQEKVSSLQGAISEVWSMRNVEESTCNTNLLKGEASYPSSDR